MTSLFAAEERESKLSKPGDPLESLGCHVDFAALAAGVDRALSTVMSCSELESTGSCRMTGSMKNPPEAGSCSSFVHAAAGCPINSASLAIPLGVTNTCSTTFSVPSLRVTVVTLCSSTPD